METKMQTIGYYLLVSGLWQKTTKEAYEACSENGLPKAKVNMEYWDESMEILRTTPDIYEAISEVEKYLNHEAQTSDYVSDKYDDYIDVEERR